MQNTGTLNSLTERMKAKAEQEQKELEALTRQQFNALSKSLSESSKNALGTTEAAILNSITDMEKNITSRCQSLGEMFNRKYWLSIALSAGILFMTVLTCWGLITLYQHRITDTRRELAALTREKEALQTQNARIWATFKGLEPHHAEGKDYLLLPAGRKFQFAGIMPDKREAWEIARK